MNKDMGKNLIPSGKTPASWDWRHKRLPAQGRGSRITDAKLAAGSIFIGFFVIILAFFALVGAGSSENYDAMLIAAPFLFAGILLVIGGAIWGAASAIAKPARKRQLPGVEGGAKTRFVRQGRTGEHRNLVERDLKRAAVICLLVFAAAMVIAGLAGRFDVAISSGLMMSLPFMATVASISTLVHWKRVRSAALKSVAIILLAWILVTIGAATTIIVARAGESSGGAAYDALGMIAGIVIFAGLIGTAVLLIAVLAAIAVENRKLDESFYRGPGRDNRPLHWK